MKFILERIRAGHEDLEYLEKAISSLLNDRKKASGVRLATIERAINSLVEESQSIANSCLDHYKDSDGFRKEEIRFLAGQKDGGKQSGSSSDDSQLWTNYYSTLKNIKDYYKHNEHLNVAIENRTVEEIVKASLASISLDSVFTPDENYGRCVDLQELYREFINLQELKKFRMKSYRQQEVLRLERKGLTDQKMMEQYITPFVEIDYATYLGSFDHFHLIPRYCKYRNEDYMSYLDNLLGYLEGFFQRQNPLAIIDTLKKQFEESFEDSWSKGSIEYWKEATESLDHYLKPVDKLFSSEGIYKSFQQGKKYKKISEAFSKKTAEELEQHSKESREHDKTLAFKESMIQGYKGILTTTIERTVDSIQKRESRTSRELEASQSLALQILEAVENEKEANEVSSGEEDEKPIYNPLNLPLGWDGKPIPFWLYKLHGLGTEFKCEICGNYSYWGRKAFENHFREWRHAFGMRCLKIPNTPHFKEITKIEDAFALYEKLKNLNDKNVFKIAQEVECEDSEGNVMNARAYEDLRRQGLL